MKQPENTPRWTERRAAKTLGVVMIVKNEAKNLPALFESIADVADEVVVVDTGSTDGTLGVCRSWGVTVIHDPWRHDFSRARNRGIQAATARYLLWLDADDRLPGEARAELSRMRDEVLPKEGRRAYLMPVQNVDAQGEVFDTFLQTRLFPRLAGARFVNRVHEQITDSLKALDVELVRTEIAVRHTGYSSPEVVREKGLRNLQLLQAETEKGEKSLHHLIHMAQTLFGLGRVQEAEAAITDALGRAGEEGAQQELLAELYALRAGYRACIANVLGATYDLEQATRLWPEWGVPYAALAESLLRESRWDDVAEMVERARAAEFVAGIVGFPLARAQGNVEWIAGRLAVRLGDHEEAVRCFRAALELHSKHLDARLELGQLLLEREDYAAARETLEPAGEDDAAAERFVEVAAAIGFARAMTGDMDGASACLAPLLDIFSPELAGAQDVSPIDLAQVMLRTGHAVAAKNMMLLFQKTMRTAA